MRKKPSSSSCFSSCISCFFKNSTCFCSKSIPATADGNTDAPSTEGLHGASPNVIVSFSPNVPGNDETKRKPRHEASSDALSSFPGNDSGDTQRVSAEGLITKDRNQIPETRFLISTSDAAKDAPSSSIPAVINQDDPGCDAVRVVQTVNDATNNIVNDLDAVEGENLANYDFHKLINHINELLRLVEVDEVKKQKPNRAERYFPTDSKVFLKLKNFLSETADFFKAIVPGDVKAIVRNVLHGMGSAHMAATGLLVVANILERFEEVSKNRDECLRLLKQMVFLAKCVQRIKEHPRSEGMDGEIKKATEMIMEGSMKCCSQMSCSYFYRFFSTEINNTKLVDLAEELRVTYDQMNMQLGIEIYDGTRPKKAALSNLYPPDAVGIEEPVREVIDLLEWSSNENAVAVILHGLGGIGKTTLANAVYSSLDIEGWQCSKVELFQDINTPGNIKELQNMILRDLTPRKDLKDIKEIRNEEEGQVELGKMLQKVKAFIFIDNVLGERELSQLLPKNINKAMKVRFLLTTRDQNHCNPCRVKTGVYSMKHLRRTEAMTLLRHEMDKRDDKKRQRDSRPLYESELVEIVNYCGGIPKLLEVTAAFIVAADNQMKAFEIVKEEHIKFKGKHLENIQLYVFAYDNLREECKDPFLDICLFFKGKNWEIVEDIVGMSELDTLEKSALVKKDINGLVSVHDVILELGRHKAKETRLKFTSADEMKKFLKRKADKDIQNIKGLWLSGNKDRLSLSSEKLDLMCRSLRILRLGNLIHVEGTCKRPLEKLIFFQGAVPRLPFDVKEVTDLKYLSYQPKDLKLSEMPSDLRYVEFDGRLSDACEIYPRDLEQLKRLRILTLTRFAKLKRLSKELGDQLNGLQELTLSCCESIEELPLSISSLKLRILRVNHCSNLTHLPKDFELLDSLQELNLQGCTNLKELPSSFGLLNSLQKLCLQDCTNLKELPSIFGSLNSLQELNLQGCTNLEELPSSFEKLSSLVSLDLSSCEKLSKLPHGIGYLASLVSLSFNKCANIKSIPESIGWLKSLAFSMDMSGCSTLKELPSLFGKLTYMEELNLSECSSLEKLPESFRQLKHLVKLNLSNCSTLQQLSHGFPCLSSLKILDLSGCKMLEELPPDFHRLTSLQNLYLSGCERLQKLPEHFHSLPSLQHLYLCYCHMLEGKSLDNLVMKEKLQIINIQESSMLVRRWEELQRQGNQSRSVAVYTGQDLSKEEKENIFQKLLSELDNLLIDERGKPFRISNLPLNTVSLVIFNSDPDDNFLCPLMEETIDDIEKDLRFKMIYIGKHFNKFPKKVKDSILCYSREIREFGLMLVKLLLTLDVDVRESWLATLDINVQKVWLEKYNAEEPIYFQMEMVEDGKGETCRPCWKVLSNCDVEKFVLGRCHKYFKLKELLEAPQSIELLRELFGTREEETIFQRSYVSNQDPTENLQPFTVDKLEGKTVLLEMGCADLCNDIGLWSLAEMYHAENIHGLEIISLPLPTVQPSARLNALDGFDLSSRQVPWLVLTNPLTMTRAAQYFLVKQCGWKKDDKDDIWNPSIIWIIEPNGRISTCKPFMRFILNMRGLKAYPFTEDKFKKLRKTERDQVKSISNLELLFNHLETVFDEVKNKMHKGKMICLYNGNRELTYSIRNALIELRDSIHIIYIPRHGHKIRKMLKITNTIYKDYYSLEKPEVLQAGMEGMSLLNLSEHEAMRFWMRLLYLKEEIKGPDDNDSQLCEMKRLLHLFQFMDEGNLNGWMTFMGEDGKMVAACRGEIMEWIFRDDRGVRAKLLMKRLIKVSKEEREQTHHDSSILVSTNNMQTSVVVDEENVDVDLNSLSDYTSELLELVQLHQFLEFNKEEKKSPRAKAARHYWPNSIGFKLKKFLSEGITVVNDIISIHREEDILEMVIQSLLEGISRKEHLAAIGLLVVAEILERFDSVSANQNECLFLLEEMNRVAQSIKQLNERPILCEGTYEKMRKATKWIVNSSIMCCAEIRPSEFAMFFRSVNQTDLHGLRKGLHRSQEELSRLLDDFYKNEDESVSVF